MSTDVAKTPVWPRFLVVLGVLPVIGLLTYGLLTTGSNTRIDEQLAQNQPVAAPGFDLAVLEPGSLPSPLRRRVGPALEDGRVELDELRGVPVVLNFWASWCTPCREEAPILQQGWERDGPRGVLYVGLDMQDLTGDARGFLQEFAIDYPSIRDPGNEVARDFGATGIPETYFIDRHGQVVGHVVGVLEERTLASGVAAALEGSVIGSLFGGDSRPQR